MDPVARPGPVICSFLRRAAAVCCAGGRYGITLRRQRDRTKYYFQRFPEHHIATKSEKEGSRKPRVLRGFLWLQGQDWNLRPSGYERWSVSPGSGFHVARRWQAVAASSTAGRHGLRQAVRPSLEGELKPSSRAPGAPINLGLISTPALHIGLEPRHNVRIQPQGYLLLHRAIQGASPGAGPIEDLGYFARVDFPIGKCLEGCELGPLLPGERSRIPLLHRPFSRVMWLSWR